MQKAADKRAGYELLYTGNAGLIHRIANKYAAYADIDDLKQEAYFALMAAVEHYREAAGAFSTYFAKVLCRRFSRYINSNKLLGVGSTDVPCGEDEDNTILELLPGSGNMAEQVTDDIFMRQVSAALWEAVDELPGNEAQIIRQQYQQDRQSPDICCRLGISMSEYRKEHRRAMQQLRKEGSRGILKEYADEYIYSAGIRNYNFKTTWTSSTEYVALKRL